MQEVAVFYSLYPFWTWLAVGALLLALEVSTGSGYLLWPAASAGVVALLTLVLHLGFPLEAVIFAVLTIATTVLARIYWPPRKHSHGHDINDRGARLIGKIGETVGIFAAGQGRVFVDGAEWSAELADDDTGPPPGARVQIVEVVGGGRLKVRAA
jgi:membrane protein implicated in regulation of membrane protease activity